MLTIISISLALLVIVAGLLLLAKTKKDGLGGLFTFSSYAIVTFGILLTAFALVGCIMRCCSSQKGCASGSYSQCQESGSGYDHHAAYNKCHRGTEHGSSAHGRCSRSSCAKKECSKASCTKGSHACKKGEKCCKKTKETEIQTTTELEGDGEEEMDVSVEIIE